MKKIILTKGLPGSGKTTWAKELLAKEPGMWKRINKDELRAMLDNGKWSKGNEKFVLDQRDFLVTTALINGYNVIVDDTNLHPKHEIRMKEIAKAHGETLDMGDKKEEVIVEIEDFTYIPVETCIKRDLLRISSVGEAVIRKMYNQFLRPKPLEVIYMPTAPMAVICDIDGTLALFGDNNPYDRDFKLDTLNIAPANIIGLNKEQGNKIILVSGRMDKFREDTEWWLANNFIEYDELYMRKTDDLRKDVIIKQEIYEEHIKGKYNVLYVLDDRNQVVDFWRSQGLTCLQVGEGDF